MTFHSSELGTNPRKPVNISVEKPQGVRPINGENRIDAPFATVPDGTGFPGASPIHNYNCSIIEAGIGIRAECVG